MEKLDVIVLEQMKKIKGRILSTFSEEELEKYEEKSAIIEYDGCLDRLKAEVLAIQLILENRGN